MMKVVIIDDNEMNVALLKNLVARALHEEPVCFLASAEALEWCRTNEADLILVDYMMPSPDGLEWIQQFRQIEGRGEIPVVMITATSEKDIRYKALQSGANDFLNKPVDTTEFLARAKNMLVLRKWQKELSNRAEWLAAEVRKATAEIIAREREVIFHLTKAAEYRSPETGSHIVRVALYSKEIAKQLGLTESEQDLILTASPMHDIGKVGTPDMVLLKGDKLDEDEYAIMKEHTVMGYEILQSS
jgi:putative two-component system response regulator